MRISPNHILILLCPSEGAVVAWRRVSTAERRVSAERAPQTGRRVPIRFATARMRI